MHLYGQQDGRDWKAMLNVEAFAACNAALIRG